MHKPKWLLNGLSLGEFDECQTNLYLYSYLMLLMHVLNLFYMFVASIWEVSLLVIFCKWNRKTDKNDKASVHWEMCPNGTHGA